MYDKHIAEHIRDHMHNNGAVIASTDGTIRAINYNLITHTDRIRQKSRLAQFKAIEKKKIWLN